MLMEKPADLTYKCAGAPATLPERVANKVDTKQKSANVKNQSPLTKFGGYMKNNKAVEDLKKLATDMNVFALAIWLDRFLRRKTIRPLPRRYKDYDTQRWQLAEYLHRLSPELQTKFTDADLTLLERLPKAKNKGPDYARSVILLLKEAPATNIDSALRILQSVMSNPTFDSAKWADINKLCRRMCQAQKRFQIQAA